MATNHFGPFLLTGLLLPQLVASGDGRVVTVSLADAPDRPQRAARRPPRPGRALPAWQAYCQTKLANLLFTFELDRRLRGPGCRSRPWPRTRGSPAPTWWPTASSAGRPAAVASILDAAVKAVVAVGRRRRAGRR